MKTLAGWIVGVFALGLVVGGVFDGTSAERTEAGLGPGLVANASLPAVDCGEGREAVLAPAAGADGQASFSVKCVATEAKNVTVVTRPAAPATAAASNANVPERAATTVASTATTENAGSDANARVDARDDSGRDWKDSALVIGGAAGAGAGIGAIAKGGKGAAVGAAVGGVAGTVYELTRKKQ